MLEATYVCSNPILDFYVSNVILLTEWGTCLPPLFTDCIGY